MMQLGMPFNLQKVITMTANELEIGDEMQEIFFDPEFQEKLETYIMMQTMGGGEGAGSTGSTRKAGPQSSQGIMQNGGYPMKREMTTPGQDMNAAAQGGADLSQQANQGVF